MNRVAIAYFHLQIVGEPCLLDSMDQTFCRILFHAIILVAARARITDRTVSLSLLSSHVFVI